MAILTEAFSGAQLQKSPICEKLTAEIKRLSNAEVYLCTGNTSLVGAGVSSNLVGNEIFLIKFKLA